MQDVEYTEEGGEGPVSSHAVVHLSKLKLDHFFSLCDDTGIFQHASCGVANRHEGYCTDDVARALIFLCKYPEVQKMPHAMKSISVCLSFLHHASQPDGAFHNFLSFDRRWLDEIGSGDSHGRALWAFGTVMGASFLSNTIREAAELVFLRGVPLLGSITSPRSWSFGMLGCAQVPHIDVAREKLKTGGDFLLRLFKDSATPEWEWFERRLTYCNARIPQALYRCYDVLRDEKYLHAAERSMHFLTNMMFEKDVLQVPGNEAWFEAGSQKSAFDQQPVEAGSTVEALVTAYRTTSKFEYLRLASDAIMWYHGRNALGAQLIDTSAGACYDGLRPTGVNRNQGAEATLSYLLARVEYDAAIKTSGLA